MPDEVGSGTGQKNAFVRVFPDTSCISSDSSGLVSMSQGVLESALEGYEPGSLVLDALISDCMGLGMNPLTQSFASGLLTQFDVSESLDPDGHAKSVNGRVCQCNDHRPWMGPTACNLEPKSTSQCYPQRQLKLDRWSDYSHASFWCTLSWYRLNPIRQQLEH